MEIKIFELPPIGTNAYLLLEPARREAVLVDAPLKVWETVEPLLQREDYRLCALLLTHGHWDHMVEAALVAEQGARVYAHAGDRHMLENPQLMAAFALPGLELEAVRTDHFLEDGERLKLLGREIEVRHVPGHSEGGVLFYFEQVGAAFSGDALFAEGIGRTDFPGGDFATLEKAIREKIYTLPEDTVLYPGHGPQTTVARERRDNPFVRG